MWCRTRTSTAGCGAPTTSRASNGIPAGARVQYAKHFTTTCSGSPRAAPEPINMPDKHMTHTQATGPARDFIGYGRNAPRVIWPHGAKVAINLVLVYEEGSEYSWLEDDGRNDNWGEYNLASSPAVRDLGTETHFEYGSRAGVWRLARLFDRYQVPVTVSACAVALQINPEVAAWMNA